MHFIGGNFSKKFIISENYKEIINAGLKFDKVLYTFFLSEKFLWETEPQNTKNLMDILRMPELKR